MPKRLTRQQRLSKRKRWLNSPRSLNGYHYQLDHELLTRCIEQGLGIRAIARKLHTYTPRIRRLLKQHGLTLPSQPKDASEYNAHNRRLHDQKYVAEFDKALDRGADLDELKRLHKLAGRTEQDWDEFMEGWNGISGSQPISREEKFFCDGCGKQEENFDLEELGNDLLCPRCFRERSGSPVAPARAPVSKPVPIVPSLHGRRKLGHFVYHKYRQSCGHIIERDDSVRFIDPDNFVCVICNPAQIQQK